MKFKDRLKDLRLSKHLTQEEFAKESGLSRSAVGMYESGKRKPSFEVLELIADFFNVNMSYLAGKEPISVDLSVDTSRDTKQPYYLDPEVAEMANELKENPDMRILFDASRKLSKQDMKTVINMVKAITDKEE